MISQSLLNSKANVRLSKLLDRFLKFRQPPLCSNTLITRAENTNKSVTVLTQIKSTTPRTCATTATIESESKKKLSATPIDLTTQVACVKTVTYKNTTSREKKRQLRKRLRKCRSAQIERNNILKSRLITYFRLRN